MEVLAYCGLNCAVCPWYQATINDDDSIRAKVVEQMKGRGIDIPIEAVNCDGCTAGKRLAPHCQQCEVRKCASGKDVKTCAHCSDYSCAKLNGLYENLGDMGVAGKQKLEEIHKTL